MSYLPPTSPEDRERRRRLSRNPLYIGALVAFSVICFLVVLAIIN